MELKQYLNPLRKWWWLLLAATLVSTLSSFLATRLQDPIYRASTTLMIGQAIDDPNPTGADFYLGQQLAQTYADIAKRQPVRQATMDALGITWLPEYNVTVQNNNQLLEIAVLDTNPERAQVVANTLAEQLVQQSPTSSQREDQQRLAFINSQLDSLETNITETEQALNDLQAEMASMISARQIADAETQVAALQTKLTTLQTNYANLVANTQQGAINSLSIIEPALLPTTTVGPDNYMTILLGAAIGFTLAAGAAYLMEYLDDTLKSPEEIGQAADLPIIGFIADTANEDEEGTVVTNQPRSPVAEAFRGLRTNLEFAGVDKPLHTILVTSPGPADGKSTVAANLAIIMAQGGKRVVLLDADLRRPRVHHFLNLPNRFGLSDVFREQLSLDAALQPWGEVSNLQVITSGSLPPNPAELLNSARMDQILADLQGLADVVIIDSPPVMVTDPSVLSARVDGVLVVIQPGRVNAASIKAMLEQFRRADARLLGIVLNRIPRQRSYYGGYRYYYAPYYYASHYYMDGEKRNGSRGSRGSRPGGRGGLFGRLRPRPTPQPTPDEP